MDAVRFHLLIASDSQLSRAWQRVGEWYNIVRVDPWGTLYWGLIWVCAFVITFLLLRMLFTRWGESNITQKTLGVSVLVHVMIGMVSNSVIFLPSGGGRSHEQPGVPIRRVVFESPTPSGDATAGNSDDPFESRNQRPGNSPAWEQAASPGSRSRARQPLSSGDRSVVNISPDSRDPAAAQVSIPAPNLAEKPQADEPDPEAIRDTGKIAQPAAVATPQIAEDTAQSRTDTSGRTGSSIRTARPSGDAGTSVSDTGGPRARATKLPADLPPTNRGIPAATPVAGGPDGSVSPGRKGEPREVSRMGGSNRATPIRDGDGNAGTSPAGSPPAVTTVPSERPFRRTGTPGRTSGSEPGGVDPGRSAGIATSDSVGPGVRGTADGGGGGPGSGIGQPTSGPQQSFGDSQVGMLSPSVMRSGSDGAIDKNSSRIPATYRLRTSPQRTKIAIEMGANEESERAVEASLKWLASHQRPQGNWDPIESTLGREPEKLNFNEAGGGSREQQQERERSGFQSEVGLTALAVLAFLGKGYTHEDNAFADNVERALRWIVAQQDAQGFLGGKANRYARMYCHGMATIALGEAYGMTKDPSLRQPLARAVNYIVAAQYPDGSWRYSDWRQLESRHRKGDMSMFGWQLMALKSAKTAGLDVPEAAFEKCVDYLRASGIDMKDRGLSQAGGLAAYRLGEAPKPAMTAEALFCKQMLGIKRTNRASVESVEYLLRHLPQHSKQDLYLWYYGTLAMYQQGGEPWRRWNSALRDSLVADQRTDGDFAGSWNPRFPWGDYGGRVFSTAVSALCLEVYYRFLPLYQTDDADRADK